ncbi:MAG: serine/threonine protein kinase, partial [Myxococcales bacterium]|nr:serine/threonine protein kinase [Myxococcales bacterium]
MMQAGQVIADRYRLESPVGEGAMAAVWQAEDLTLKRQVAIKFLFVKGTRDPQGMVDQFLREARIAASVQHRNVIHTVDFGTYQEYQPF